MMIKRNCLYCGAKFLTRFKPQRFCSRSCADKSRRVAPTIRVCEHCTARFSLRYTRSKAQRFCCHSCAHAARVIAPPVARDCAHCGTKFVSRFKAQSFCCRSCARSHEFRDPGYCARHRAAHNTPEYLASQSVLTRQRWADPTYRAKVQAACSTPEFRALQKETSRKLWADPTFRARTRSSMQAACSTPEFRALQKEISRKRYADDHAYWQRIREHNRLIGNDPVVQEKQKKSVISTYDDYRADYQALQVLCGARFEEFMQPAGKNGASRLKYAHKAMAAAAKIANGHQP